MKPNFTDTYILFMSANFDISEHVNVMHDFRYMEPNEIASTLSRVILDFYV